MELLEADVTITAREVTRRHPALKHASSITRNGSRSEALKAYQAEQEARREWLSRTRKRSREGLAAQLAQKELQVTDLERQVELLRIAHLTMIRAVGEMGGMSKLLRLYESYGGVRQELARIGALPSAEVKTFELPKSV